MSTAKPGSAIQLLRAELSIPSNGFPYALWKLTTDKGVHPTGGNSLAHMCKEYDSRFLTDADDRMAMWIWSGLRHPTLDTAASIWAAAWIEARMLHKANKPCKMHKDNVMGRLGYLHRLIEAGLQASVNKISSAISVRKKEVPKAAWVSGWWVP